MSLEDLSRRFLEEGTAESRPQAEFVEEAVEDEDSEHLGGSLTNEVFHTYMGTVLKEFSERPKMAYIQALGSLPSGGWNYQCVEDRKRNEETFREHIDELDIDVEVPEILGAEDQYVEFEHMNGESMDRYLNDATDSEAEEAGTMVGNFLSQIHGNGGAVTDLRINNFMMMEQDTLGFVDAEYFVEDASGWDRTMDLITLSSSIKQVEPGSYRAFREGFSEEYSAIGTAESAVSSPLSMGHAALLERDAERIYSAARNNFGDLASYLTRN